MRMNKKGRCSSTLLKPMDEASLQTFYDYVSRDSRRIEKIVMKIENHNLCQDMIMQSEVALPVRNISFMQGFSRLGSLSIMKLTICKNWLCRPWSSLKKMADWW